MVGSAPMPNVPEAELRADLPGTSPTTSLRPRATCAVCGRVFIFSTLGMAKMQATKHRQKVHPDADPEAE